MYTNMQSIMPNNWFTRWIIIFVHLYYLNFLNDKQKIIFPQKGEKWVFLFFVIIFFFNSYFIYLFIYL